MAKKKKRYYKNDESPTKDFRNIAQVTMGGGMVGTLTPLMNAPTPCNLQSATEGMIGFAILAPMTNVGFNAIDNISKSGKKRK